MMRGFLDYFFSHVSATNLVLVSKILDEMFASFNLYFWFIIVIPLVRFNAVPMSMWLTNLIYPKLWFATPQLSPARRKPKVSVVIPGRNEAHRVDRTIVSILSCGYPNLEIIFVDDASNDETFYITRRYAWTGRVKALRVPLHSGRASCLNIGIAHSAGEFVFFTDADSELERGAIESMLDCFENPRMGAVGSNLRVRNAPETLVTRLQEVEYAFSVTLSRTWHAKLGILPIVAGASGMYRRAALDSIGYFDTGLGDDTDNTLRLRKAGWEVGFTPYGAVWTDVPATFRRLVRQRSRWERVMVKIRTRKHGNMIRANVFGLRNAYVALDIFLFRLFYPLLTLFGISYTVIFYPFEAPIIITFLFWITAMTTFINMLILNDIFGHPRLGHAILRAPQMPLYRLTLRLCLMVVMVQELLRLQLKHPYIPERIWRHIPHW